MNFVTDMSDRLGQRSYYPKLVAQRPIKEETQEIKHSFLANVFKKPESLHRKNVELSFTIITILLALYFAYKANSLTAKYGEQQDQLDELKSMAKSSAKTSEDLVSVLFQLRQQNQRTDTTIGLLKKELEASDLTQAKTNELTILQNNANQQKFTTFAYSLGDYLGTPDHYSSFDNGAKIQVLNELEVRFNEVAGNPYLLSKKRVYEDWYTLYADIKLLKKYATDIQSQFDGGWWDKNYPFKELMDRIFLFYWEHASPMTSNYQANSIAAKFLDKAVNKIAVKVFDTLSSLFDNMRKEFNESLGEIEQEVNRALDTMGAEVKAYYKPSFKILVDSLKKMDQEFLTQIKRSKREINKGDAMNSQEAKKKFDGFFPKTTNYRIQRRKLMRSFIKGYTKKNHSPEYDQAYKRFLGSGEKFEVLFNNFISILQKGVDRM